MAALSTALLLLFCSCSRALGDRLEIPFGYGWRYYYGDDPTGPGAGPGGCSFTDITGWSCQGLEHDPNRFTQADCQTACCYDTNCLVWQHNAKTCMHGGANATCTKPSKAGGDAGGMRSGSQPFQRDFKFIEKDFPDTSWEVVDTPRDFLINHTFVNNGDTVHGYLLRNVSWYRKHFTVPAEWKGSTVLVDFEGVFQYTEVWLNGQHLMDHRSGYTGFTVRLDNVTSLVYGAENVLALRVDASFGSGHWYEGGGIYRPVRLVVLPPLHFTADGVFVSPESDGTVIKASAEVEAFAKESTVSVTFELFTDDGEVVARNTTASTAFGSTPRTVACELRPTVKIGLWSVQQPRTYRIVATVGSDRVERTVGFRTVVWSNKGFSLNGVGFKLRGFSHHNSFAGVGVAMSPRMHLFRAQAQKAVGGNFWRMSHNPYEGALYDILDAVGVLVWDENRDFGAAYACEMHDMVKAHRNHPSVVTWSYCNEFECMQVSDAAGRAFRDVAKALDPDRATAANMNGNGPSAFIDIQGLSHQGEKSFEKWHSEDPAKPLVLSECCSCTTNRMDSRTLPSCIADQNSPGLLPYVAGSLGVWTLMDYFGEQHEWPAVTCSYGQFDIAGFPKSHVWWYRTNWLAMDSLADPGRPAVADKVNVARVLTLPGSVGASLLTVASANVTELLVDGKSLGRRTAPAGTAVEWDVTESSHNFTLLSYDTTPTVVASHTAIKAKAATGLKVTVDVPSPSTGTGSALYLDGVDTALLRAEIVDASGVVVTTHPATNVTFSIVSGPGRIIGVGNGDPACHQLPGGQQIVTYGGIARGVVRVTVDCTSPNREKRVDIDTAHTDVMTDCPSTPVVVQASAGPFTAPPVAIQVSGSSSDSPLGVARRSSHLAGFTYLDTFQA
eukprot:Sspe_Gene.49409::Locus_26619_Transcript_1_1_Confidence_1.000_Length_2869::g.49409::m.49409/K01190/lacZ; beta-galactosidase